MSVSLSRVSRSVVGLVGAGALLLAGAGAASAHVTVKTDNTTAGAYTILTFGVPHGCDGSATTRIDIAVPDEIETITPGVNYGWTLEVTSDDEATPDAAGHGESAPISEIVYTAKEPLPDEFYDQFLVQVKLPEAAEGETIYFPVVQTCEEGETAWVQIPAEGESSDDLEAPAPSITVTEAEDEEN